MIRASQNGKRILLCSDAQDIQRVARLPGAKRAPNMQPFTYFLPLCDGALEALRDVGADFCSELVEYERHRQRVHAYIEGGRTRTARPRHGLSTYSKGGRVLMAYLSLIARDASPQGYGALRSITIRLYITNCSGEVYFTDLMLQAGSVATGWVGHVCEIQWTLDG